MAAVAHDSQYIQPEDGWATAPAVLAGIGAVLCLLISSNLLVAVGIPYTLPYGSFIAKLHPGTYFILAAFLLLLLRANPVTSMLRFARRRPAAMIFAAAVVVMSAYTVASYGLSGAAFLVDTLLAPALLAIVLDHASPRARSTLFSAVVGIMAINSVLGLMEIATQARLIPYMRGDQLIVEDYFRATALQGHPLSNSLRTLVVMLCALVMVGHRRSALFLTALLFTSLLAFGSRTGLVMAVLLGAAWLVPRSWTDIRIHGLATRKRISTGFALLAGAAALGLFIAFGNLGERIFSLLYFDQSAQARVTALRAFSILSPSELWFGMGPSKIETVLFYLRQSSSVTDIENIWLVFTLQFGLLLTLMFAAALILFLWALARRSPWPVVLATIGFAVFVLSNNSLASKSQDMVVFVAAVMTAPAWASREARIHRVQQFLAGRYAFPGSAA